MSAFYDLASLVLVPSGYKASKVYAQKPLTTDGQLTFSRASTATRVNASGLIETVASNVPRLDYLGSTCPKLNLEPQRTNLVTFSEQMDNAGWIKTDATISANVATSPDGFTDADKFIETATTGSHIVSQATAVTASVLTASVFLKQSEIRYAVVFISNTINKNFAVLFDLQLGVIVTNFTSISSYTAPTASSIQNYGNGWYRCSVTATDTFTNAALAVALNKSGADSGFSYVGDGTSGLFAYGAQVEAGAYATSYIPTTTAAVTRLADNCLKTGIGSLIGTEFTLYYAGRSKTGQDGQITRYMSAKGTGSLYSSFVTLEQNGLNIDVNILDNSSVSKFTANTPLALNTNFKVAIRAKSGSIAFYVNGTQIAVSSATYTMTSNAIYIGYYVDGGIVNSALSEAMVLPSTLTNAQLAELTTL